jgi:hypothetical protein
MEEISMSGNSRTMKWYGLAAMTALLVTVDVSAQSAPVYFKLSSNPQFDKYRPALVDYLRGEHFGKPTRFCLFGSKDNSGAIATVIWLDGQRIIDWGGNDSTLAESNSVVNLKTDVVPTERDLHGSTYLVTRKWVSEQLVLCKRNGETVRVGAVDVAR